MGGIYIYIFFLHMVHSYIWLGGFLWFDGGGSAWLVVRGLVGGCKVVELWWLNF
jgi:hypothetical protein